VAIQTDHSPADNPLVGKVLEHRCVHPCDSQTQEGFCQIISPLYRISHLAAPLYLKGKVIGALCAGSSNPDAFRPEIASILTQLSDVAVVALENSRLYQRAEYAATLEERQRIASEMHDSFLQTISYLRLMVNMVRDQLETGETAKVLTSLRKIERAEEQAELEIRRTIDSLQDEFPLDDTLQEGLSNLVKELSTNTPAVVFETGVVIPLVISRQENEQVLRITQEAVLNAQRYSKTNLVKVSLEKDGDELILSIADNGTGFQASIPPQDGREHFGLKIMRARASRLGGKLDVNSTPGCGTVVQLHWKP